MNTSPANPAFWSQSAEDAFRRLRTGVFGLTGAEANRRLAEGGGGLRKSHGTNTTLRLLLGQFKSPIISIRVFPLRCGRLQSAKNSDENGNRIDTAKFIADFPLQRLIALTGVGGTKSC